MFRTYDANTKLEFNSKKFKNEHIINEPVLN